MKTLIAAIALSMAIATPVTKQLQAVQAKADSALKDRTQVEQATAKQAEALRDQLATAKQQVSDAQAAAKAARIELSTANAEIARLKAEPAEKPTSSAAQ